ncbi:TetR/AcrR family transcriptional regulator [Pontibacter burrus]|uniref:TetR/AcrR family transcriptional regulator n=1 Tax=Pontibacter burrus TaxID=2704466 RepID=A0A6B3LPH9_9BACT|nr:TetR/AcrR family transcriptional regulator [Pontibacter burrus]NEM96096.1 TetR/AcrR family transcriptional regulator [Pontibacter burrus]
MSNAELEERTDNRQKISETAFQLFCQRGIKSVSMDDIAQFLGMSKKTIYKWFDNKNEIVVASTGAYLQDMQQRCEVHFQNSGNAIEELFNIMAMTRELFNQFHPSVFHDLQKYHPDAFKLWMKHRDEYMFEKIRENLLRGIKEGLYRKDLDVDVMAKIRLVQVELPFNPILFPPLKYDLRRVQMATLEHYMLGLATLKGHKLINELKHIKEEE